MKILAFLFTLILLSLSAKQISGQSTAGQDKVPDTNGETSLESSKESENVHVSLNNTKDFNDQELPMAIYVKAHSFFRTTKAFRNYTFQDTVRHINEISKWKAPPEYERKFAYNHSGYDHNDQPVWIAAVGKYDIREQTSKGPEAAKNLTQYLFQASLRILISMAAKDTPGREIRRAYLVGDAAGIDTTQAAHIPTSQFMRNLANTYGDFYALGLGHALIFNTTPLQMLAFKTLRPTLGNSYDKIELFGYEKTQWQMALRNQLPLSAIPAWYGGSEDYKATQVFG